tara:strand:- start:22108 stop:23700 length:1593 start_codon:yes stop_codon:yes gene_type:complete
MSRTDNQGTTLDFDINLIAVSTDENNKEVADPFPLELNSIRYLEITDSLVNMGLVGVVTYNNYYQILDKIGITKSADKTMYLSIDINDAQLGEVINTKADSSISFLSMLETNADLSTNVANKSSVYKFEEAIPALLKKAAAIDILEGVTKTEEAPMLIKHLLTGWADSKGVADFVDNNFITNNSNKLQISNIWQIEDSIYDVVYKLYNSFVFGSVDTPIPPLLKLRNNEENERRLTLTPIIDDAARQFIKDYNNNVAQDHADIYQEEFIITDADESGGNSSLYNKVEQYNLIKPDYKTIRQNIWGKYSFVGNLAGDEPADLTTYEHDFIYHSNYVDIFSMNVLGGFVSNIPQIPEAEQKAFTQVYDGSESDNTITVQSRVLNKVLKSFILLNETIVLNVEGKIYRKAGKFITIKGGEAIGSLTDRLSNLWYIVEVKHIFTAGYYTNEITAVRLIGRGEVQPSNVSVQYDFIPEVPVAAPSDNAAPVTEEVIRGPKTRVMMNPLPSTNSGDGLPSQDDSDDGGVSSTLLGG